MKFVLLNCLIFTIIVYGHALKCPTCEGDACRNEEVPLVECGFGHRYPISARTAMVSAEANYGCLHFTYLKNGNIQEVKECIVNTPEKNVCQKLKEIYDLQSCKVQANLLKVNSKNGGEGDPSSTNSTTTTPAATTTTPASTTTTPAATTTTPASTTTTPAATTTTPASTTTTPAATTTPATSSPTTPKNSGEISQISTVFAIATVLCVFYF